MNDSSVLIVRLGALGDIVHALPLAAALRAHAPRARIDWVVEARHRALLELVPVLSGIVTLESTRAGGERGWWPTIGRLRSVGYDAVLDAQGLIKSAVLARLAGARRTIGFDARHLREPAARVFYSETVAPAGATHVADKTLALAAAVGAPATPRAFPIDVPEPDALVAAAVRDAGGRFAAINPGAAWPNKRWPAERFGELAARLFERERLVSLVTWGPGEEVLAGAVVTASGGAARLAPSTGIAQLLALLRRAAVFVGGDTGPLHFAAAVGTPVVGVYGPTDPRRNGPWHAADRVVARTAQCECSHRRRCHAARWCLLDVTVDEVADVVSARLALAARRP